MVHGCTIIARNYMAHARVLAQSFAQWHPQGRFTVLIVDDEPRRFDGRDERFRSLRLSDIGLEADDISQLAAIYDVTELATAVKPVLLSHLLSEGAPEIVYLDPDIRLYRPIEDVAQLAREHEIVLTPHLLAPLPRDGKRISEFDILAAGIYNLGFIAVSSKATKFLDWWWSKTRRDARVAPARMMFTDQRWVDFVPSLFRHSILKDPSYNVAYWNLHERDLEFTDGEYRVNGSPLTFFHFSGFDTRRPYLLSKHQGDRPRILFSERPDVARICGEYLTSLEEAGVATESAFPYGWDALPSGLRFDKKMRRLYREALEEYEKGHGPQPPSPLDPSQQDRFIAWLNEPAELGLRPRLSRYLYAIHEDRADLRRAFPDVTGDDHARYLEWLLREGIAQERVHPSLSPSNLAGNGSETLFTPASHLTPGLNIAGYFRAEVGVGEAARLLTAAVEAAGVEHSTLSYDVTPSRKGHPFSERGDRRSPHDINVLCVNADQTAAFAQRAGNAFFEGRHTVGYWFWELEQFPPAMHQAFDYVDEVWTATTFVAGGIKAIGRRPVHVVPLAVPVPLCSPAVTRASLGLPAGFMFLYVFDFFSVVQRKNPIGLIDAFKRAFQPGEGPTLVLKSINGDAKLTELEHLRDAAGDRPDIVIVDGYYTSEQKNALLGLCDCYVSLHRSEGLGLTMAEAMGLGKPVIATAYSGNLDFMTPDNSYLVDYTIGSVPPGCDPYPIGSRWADPNLDAAAECMRRVYGAPAEAAAKARRGQHDIVNAHNVDSTAKVMKQRIDDIRSARQSHLTPAASYGRSAGTESALESPLFAMLDHIDTQLAPQPSVEPGRPLGSLVLAAQRLLFKILRPYWWQQRALQIALIAAVRESLQLANRAARAEPAQREALQALWSAVHALEAAAAQKDSAEQVNALSGELAAVASAGSELQQRLYAVPFMSDPDRLHFTDNKGRRVMGFENGVNGAAHSYADFEDIFRGSESMIRDRQRVYVPILNVHERVLDIGCGRGEMLDLLTAAGKPAIGVDRDASMVERCRSKGHAVEHVDALSYLRDQADGSLPAIFAAQVVEHLTYPEFMEFLRLCHSKLRSRGQLVFETVNPHALEAFKTFHTDLGHQLPIFPEVAVAQCWLAGFEAAFVMFPHGSGDLESDRRTEGEYAVIARTSGRPQPATA